MNRYLVSAALAIGSISLGGNASASKTNNLHAGMPPQHSMEEAKQSPHIKLFRPDSDFMSIGEKIGYIKIFYEAFHQRHGCGCDLTDALVVLNRKDYNALKASGFNNYYYGKKDVTSMLKDRLLQVAIIHPPEQEGGLTIEYNSDKINLIINDNPPFGVINPEKDDYLQLTIHEIGKASRWNGKPPEQKPGRRPLTREEEEGIRQANLSLYNNFIRDVYQAIRRYYLPDL
ncbi:hypothetical protein JW711_03585 [Candidatus Woesearchaeota archaeon]|nr:hypothetical protein [Candidatus Woesearchaeota archaeon]